jgi:signal transduction histidine kinase
MTEHDSNGTCELAGSLPARFQVAVDAQRRFVATASHELRTVLTLQRVLLESALADPNADEHSLRTTCGKLLDAGAEQERLLESLLALAASERKLEHREPIDLKLLADRALTAHREEFDRRSLTVTQTLAPAATSGDSALVGRLVGNLIDNAVQHNIPGGHLTVATMIRSERAILTVANSGEIVPADQLDRLLEPFQRLARHRRAAADVHHGLGLSIVRAIAAAHDSTLTLACHEGGGLTVTVGFKPLRAARGRDVTGLSGAIRDLGTAGCG